MSDEKLKEMNELDRAAEKAGGYVSPVFSPTTHYNYRKIVEHCKANKIDPRDMTIRELEKFIAK